MYGDASKILLLGDPVSSLLNSSLVLYNIGHYLYTNPAR